ncbi:hypothetical protein C0995_009889 [Termitomyces sp. Mi166|nr:hypothetical protein C0995_009889 [Termitomyces sp. Mi166\
MVFELDIPGKFQAGWERNAYIACATLVAYEYLLQIDAEASQYHYYDLIRLQASSRYYSLGYNISNAVVILELRLYAMYGNTREILALFVTKLSLKETQG